MRVLLSNRFLLLFPLSQNGRLGRAPMKSRRSSTDPVLRPGTWYIFPRPVLLRFSRTGYSRRPAGVKWLHELRDGSPGGLMILTCVQARALATAGSGAQDGGSV